MCENPYKADTAEYVIWANIERTKGELRGHRLDLQNFETRASFMRNLVEREEVKLRAFEISMKILDPTYGK